MRFGSAMALAMVPAQMIASTGRAREAQFTLPRAPIARTFLHLIRSLFPQSYPGSRIPHRPFFPHPASRIPNPPLPF